MQCHVDNSPTSRCDVKSQLLSLQVSRESLTDLYSIMCEVGHEWMNIGVLLGSSMATLKKILHDEHNSSDACLYRMLSEYFNHSGNCRWSVIVAAAYQFSRAASEKLFSLCKNLYPAYQALSNARLEEMVEAANCSFTGHVPDLRNSFMALIPLASSWQQIARNLRLPEHYVSSIRYDHHSSCYAQLREMLHVVFTCVMMNLTWFSLANVVKRIDHKISKQLETKGIIRESVCMRYSVVNSGNFG